MSQGSDGKGPGGRRGRGKAKRLAEWEKLLGSDESKSGVVPAAAPEAPSQPTPEPPPAKPARDRRGGSRKWDILLGSSAGRQGGDGPTPSPENRASPSPTLRIRLDLATLTLVAAVVGLVFAGLGSLSGPAGVEPGEAAADLPVPPANLCVAPLLIDGRMQLPTWRRLREVYGIENAYFEISIRQHYGLQRNDLVDRYWDQQLRAGEQIRIFLADPGASPPPDETRPVCRQPPAAATGRPAR